MSKGKIMRPAMAMIEVIFAIVIIAISVMTIPSMLAVADTASKGMMVDEDVLKRMMDEITKVYSTRWDQNSVAPFGPLQSTEANLSCSRDGGLYRSNPNTTRECLLGILPNMAIAPVNGTLNLSQGVEQLHNNPYNIMIDTNDNYVVPMRYDVSYVDSTIGALNVNGTAAAIWKLGAGSNAVSQTNLKRIVVTSESANSKTNIVLTFFKSNVGMVSE